jgi:phospholipid/cholesterol/gamma-HCH transport system ATP-binding protein
MSFSRTEAEMEAFISIRNLHKKLGGKEVLRGFDLDVQHGETLVVIGRSGGGKSVLLKHIIGLMKPTKGEIHFEGRNIATLSERQLAPIRKKIAILFQSAALFDSMSVEENVAFPLHEAGITDEAVIAQKVATALEVVDLAGEQKNMPENLRGHEKTRGPCARHRGRTRLHPLRRADHRP